MASFLKTPILIIALLALPGRAAIRTTRAASLTLLAAGAFALVAAKPALAGQFHGVVTQGALSDADYQRMGQGNVGTLRLPISWYSVEPTLGNRNWMALDHAVETAGANGVRVLPTIQGPGPVGTAHPPTDRSSRQAFARFARAMAARYGRGGEFWQTQPFSAPIRAWQLYNEQNGPANWDARPNPRAYAKLVIAASKAIRREGRAEVVLGGMFGTPSGAGGITSWTYLKKLYRVRGMKQAFDTVAVHPYSPTLRGLSFQVRKIRKVMRSNRDRRAGLRVTEIGWGSAPHGNLNKGLRGQARMLTKAFRLLERNRRAWRLKGVNWFAWQDNPAGACSFCPTSGLFTAGGAAKPAWSAFKRAAR